MQVHDLKNELASVIKDLKARVEFEKTFGIDVFPLPDKKW